MRLQDAYCVLVTPATASAGSFTLAGSGARSCFKRAEFDRLRKAGASFAYALRDEPWGQRRFALRDPAGTWIDVVQQIESAPGFWDPYVG